VVEDRRAPVHGCERLDFVRPLSGHVLREPAELMRVAEAGRAVGTRCTSASLSPGRSSPAFSERGDGYPWRRCPASDRVGRGRPGARPTLRSEGLRHRSSRSRLSARCSGFDHVPLASDEASLAVDSVTARLDCFHRESINNFLDRDVAW